MPIPPHPQSTNLGEVNPRAHYRQPVLIHQPCSTCSPHYFVLCIPLSCDDSFRTIENSSEARAAQSISRSLIKITLAVP
ncbi:hypothetical protein XELAEV_18002865mg [Xenopus laevis]|uniref:Uncharacterized protein n=1 Tax=Xenopus laevis TaxID=8355 RepID=A0A974GYA0_XENLA|nr:hypothetical protein XELAEV_18002865mg [Xenopus laevis]